MTEQTKQPGPITRVKCPVCGARMTKNGREGKYECMACLIRKRKEQQ